MTTEITETSTTGVAVSRPKITLLMVLCGLVGVTSVGAVNAATPAENVPSITVRFDPQSLETDSGARAVYRRLETAAKAVCPDPVQSRPFASRAVEHCREQAVARAVHAIDSPRLAEIYTTSAKRG